jgi:hypothetical protein
MARKKDQPAPPVEQKPIDLAPSARDQGDQPRIEEAAQPLVVETPAPAPEPEPEPAPAPPAEVEPELPIVAKAEVEPLAQYAARIEEAAQPLPVCQITHPDAKDGGLHVGKYAGIRLMQGKAPAALLSDGSTI